MKTPIEAMKMALEELQKQDCHYGTTSTYVAITALTEAIEQMEDVEPVAWMCETSEGSKYLQWFKENYANRATPLYPHPAPIPDDMVLVPREPTHAMCGVMVFDSLCYKPSKAHIYKAMIAAWEKEQGRVE